MTPLCMKCAEGDFCVLRIAVRAASSWRTPHWGDAMRECPLDSPRTHMVVFAQHCLSLTGLAALLERRTLLRLQYSQQISRSGDFARIASAVSGNSSNPLQPEPPCICSRYSNRTGVRGGPGGSAFCVPPAALRRFRRAKAAIGKHGTRMFQRLCARVKSL